MRYEHLSVSVRLAAIRTRITELERQHLQLTLRIEAPDLVQPVGDGDHQNLQILETSLKTLKDLESQLSQERQKEISALNDAS